MTGAQAQGVGVPAGGPAPAAEPRISAADANREFYRQVAERYDASEHCVVDPAARAMLRGLLSRGLELQPATEPRVLDACGGSGNAAQALLDLGVTPTVVDISPEMLERWRGVARSRGVEAPIVEAEITEFLSRDDRAWEMIVFSSALHHLQDYEGVVAAACRRLAPGGVLVSAFDPVRLGVGGQLLRRVDYAANLLRHEPRAFLGRVAAKARRSASSAGDIGALAERDAVTGVDEAAIERELERSGVEVIEHRRDCFARTAAVRAALRLARRPTSFSLLARRPLDGGS